MENTKELEVSISGKQIYTLYLLPIIGEKSNKMVDKMISDGEIDYDAEADIVYDFFDFDGDGYFRICMNFYNADDMYALNFNGEEFDQNDANLLDIFMTRYCYEDDPIECKDYKFADGLVNETSTDVGREIYKDIMDRHNQRYEDDNVDAIKDALCRRMRQIGAQLEEKGLIESADNLRFILQYGTQDFSSIEYVIPVTGDIDFNLLHPIYCQDWQDCDVCDMLLHSDTTDRLAEFIVYDGKLYEGECIDPENYDYTADIVDINLKSLM